MYSDEEMDASVPEEKVDASIPEEEEVDASIPEEELPLDDLSDEFGDLLNNEDVWVSTPAFVFWNNCLFVLIANFLDNLLFFDFRFLSQKNI